MTSPPPLAADTAVTGSAATAWAEAILADLGISNPSSADISSLVDWFGREGGGGENNPLNTTLRTSASVGSINSVGVQSYGTPAGGAEATAQTLEGSDYANIVADLKSGAGLIGQSNVSSELSTWSGGGYSSVSGANATLTSATSGAGGSSGPDSIVQAVQGFFTGLGDAFTGGAVSDLGDIATAIVGLAEPVVKVAEALDWLFRPSSWIRVFCGIGGSVLMLGGAFQLTHTGGEIPVSAYGVSTAVGVPRAASLPMGIAMTGVGAILLFVAFHNLPSSVKTFPEFLRYLSLDITSGQAVATADATSGTSVSSPVVAV